MTNDLENIKRELEKELKKQSLDFGRVLSLANEIAVRDEGAVRFSIDAGVINRLGRELVAKKETAVAELIKNSFDADATEVGVSFSVTNGGKITIKDNGNGMTEDRLKLGYMRIATDEKIKEPVSPKYKRNRAGKKGIGRFATQRLGHCLRIETRSENAKAGLVLEIDWDKFETGRDLFEIESLITKIPKRTLVGTTLVITKLRDEWNEEEIKTVYSEILDLLQPFPLNKKRKVLKKRGRNLPKLKKPDFQVEIDSHKAILGDVKINLQTQIYDYAVAEIDAFVDQNGYAFVSYDSKGLKEHEENLPLTNEGKPIHFTKLKNTALKAYYYIYKKKLINRTREKDILKLAQFKGGIRVYRNGFKVSPYGERGDDWLGLDASSRGRKFLPPHANINFLGFVELTDSEGTSFEETASREKLIETIELDELKVFAYEALIAVVLRIAAVRGKKETASQKNWSNFNEARKQLRDVIVRLNSTIDEARAYMRHDGASKPAILEELITVAAEAKSQVEKFDRTYSSYERKSLQEQAMLRILSSLGLVIGEFTHEIRQTLNAVSLGSSQLIDLLEKKTEALEIAVELAENIKRFNTYASYFGETIAANADRDLFPQNLETEVDRFIDTIRPVAVSSGITIIKKVSAPEEQLVTCPMHPSEWASILYNLYSNSHKAIIRSGNEGKILVDISADESRVYLAFSDNGDGIPENNKDRIFDPFFSTTRRSSSAFETEIYPNGAGLGLKIVRDIVTSYGGGIYLDSPSNDYETTFLIEIPKEIEEV